MVLELLVSYEQVQKRMPACRARYYPCLGLGRLLGHVGIQLFRILEVKADILLARVDDVEDSVVLALPEDATDEDQEMLAKVLRDWCRAKRDLDKGEMEHGEYVAWEDSLKAVGAAAGRAAPADAAEQSCGNAS
jgi:hypothetical protein